MNSRSIPLRSLVALAFIATRWISRVGGEDDVLLMVHDALEKFALQEPRKAELVKLRYFVGLSNDEAADVGGLTRARGCSKRSNAERELRIQSV